MADPNDGAPDVTLVRRLLLEQAPELAALDVQATAASGSSNWVYRIGLHHAVRMPVGDEYVADLEKEITWLPHVASHLPVPVPQVRVASTASTLFNRPWTVVSWVEGEPPGDLDPEQQHRLAVGLGTFCRALHEIDTAGQPSGAERWGYRCGEPVTSRMDRWLEAAADTLSDEFVPEQVHRAWELLRDVPQPTVPPTWVHADLSAENVLVSPDGTLSGVIDFGSLGIGDPSIDLLYAWSMFDASAREAFRMAAAADEATWKRARAWAFVGPGLLTLAHYRDRMPARTARLTRMVEAVAAEVGVELR